MTHNFFRLIDYFLDMYSDWGCLENCGILKMAVILGLGRTFYPEVALESEDITKITTGKPYVLHLSFAS